MRVVVVARSPVVVAGLSALLEQAGFSVAPYFGIGAGFSDSVTAPSVVPNPDVVVIETTSVASDPAGAALSAEFPGIPAVFLSDSAPGSVIPAGSGVPTARLRRDAGRDELAAAVRAVAAGLDVYDPLLGDRSGGDRSGVSETGSSAGGHGEQPGGDGDLDPLTRREIEVLRQLAGGLTNKAIAYDLGISEHTVKYHVGSILTKLDVSGRTEAVIVAARRGLIAL